ncbi:MAG: thiamine phosphate synthase [Methanoregula sp.]|jgi:thiamine-phosphate pyrophosphorylase|nr:thiamine phosphate synthase [Methanoregula sp.]
MNMDLYVITDTTLSQGRSHEEIARLAIEGGADVVQIRDKECSARELVAAGKRVREVTKRTGTLFIVNDHLDAALACGADGVHLGQDDLPVATARAIAPPGFIIGVSVGSADEARKAVEDGADYLAASPVFFTAQKTDVKIHCGLEGIRRIRAATSLPVIAIGGIGMDNVCGVIGAGADGVAVISAVVGQQDITGAARALKNRIRECKAGRVHIQDDS